jgi:C4-dicarboxylate transporter DctM subunit
MGLILLGIFLSLVVLGMPVAFALAIAGTVGLFLADPTGDLLVIVPQELFRSMNSFPLLTIPLFIFAGTLMAQGGVGKRLMDLAQKTVGRGPGGLGAAVVGSTMFFHGISGSSTADTAAIGRVVLPSMREQGYPLPFSAAVLASAGATATLIPPTIDLIIIGIIANISIAGLFAAGVIPALINGLGLICIVVFISWYKGYGRYTRVSLLDIIKSFVLALPALVMIVIILGGIMSGVFTPTEASAVAVAYAVFVSTVVYRDLKWRMLPEIFRNTLELSGMVLLVIAGGAILGYAMTFNRVPQQLADLIVSTTDSWIVFLLLVQVTFFIVGMMMDGLPALLVLMPILTPIAIQYGIHPIHFGILVEINVALGLATPPVGLCLYAACAVSGLPIERIVKPIIPLLAMLVFTMLIATYVPELSMYLPRKLGYVD